MKDLGQMNKGELQRTIDDSLFSVDAWTPSQIVLREACRGEIVFLATGERYDSRSGKRIAAGKALGVFVRGDRGIDQVRSLEVARV